MRRTTPLLGLLVGFIAAGCALSPTNLAPGSRCVRSTQCNPGLVCAGGICTADLDGFGGTVPVVDSGAVDAPSDMDAPMEDTGPIVMIDSGPGVDAPVPPGMDSGPPPVDAPVVTPDTPVVMPDTPPATPDAPVEVDAGADEDAP